MVVIQGVFPAGDERGEKSVKLFGTEYKITRPNSKRTIGRLVGMAHACDGMICQSERKIRLYRWLNTHDELSTYFHELLHAVCDWKKLYGLTRKEGIINKLADGLTSWAEENRIKVPIK